MTIPKGALPGSWDHFDLILGLTEDLLPVASQGMISPSSSLTSVGKTPSIYNYKRQVIGLADWTHRITTAEDIAKWVTDLDLGICLQTRRVRALDIDVPDKDLGDQIWETIEQFAPNLPSRTRSDSHKYLLLFELPGDYTKRIIRTQKGIIEFLATGQQCVVDSTHPDGARYQWLPSLPSSIPTIDPETFEKLWTKLALTYAMDGSVTSSPSVKKEKLAQAANADPVVEKLIVLKENKDGRLDIECPFQDEHSSGVNAVSSTSYYPAHTGGYINGHFHCLHASCAHRSDQDFLYALGISPLDDFDDLTQETPESVSEGRRYVFQQAAEFAAGPPPTWLIDGIIPRATMGVLFGASGSGKSFMAIDLGFCVATGTTWRDKDVEQGVVAYVCAEGANGFKQRLHAYTHQYQINLPDVPFHVLGEAPDMVGTADTKELILALMALGKVDLVVIDTLAQVLQGDENSGVDMGRILVHCRLIHKHTGAMVLLVHHSGKDAGKGSRGHSSLRGNADVELEVVRAQDERMLSVTKMKDADDGAEYSFRLITVPLDAEGERTSCVVEHKDTIPRALRKKPLKGANAKVVMSVLEELAGVTSEPVDILVLREKVVEALPLAEGKRDQRPTLFKAAFESLVDGNHVVFDGTWVQKKD